MLICSLFLAASTLAPQSGFPVSVPLLDLPYNTEAASQPSMPQALALSASFYEGSHWLLGRFLTPRQGGWKGFGHRMAYFGIDMVLAYLPLGDAWAHEEFHRAVMGHRGIESHNAVYDLDIGAATIPVDRVRDADLVRLKREHPADMVRLPAAGIEGQLLLTRELEKRTFFAAPRADLPYHEIAIAFAYFNTYAYVSSGATKDADTLTDELNAIEKDVPSRDFVGHDFTSWAYDLFRPDEPYEARGVHPTGVGLDRYRKNQDLTRAESRYLGFMGKLMLLNLVDSSLFRPEGLEIEGGRAAFHLKQFLTSFGYATDLGFFVDAYGWPFTLTLTRYRNETLSMPGLALELVELPLAGVPFVRAVSVKASGWLQPERQRFRDRNAQRGAAGGATLFLPFGERRDLFVAAELKTAGWVPGNPSLDRAESMQVGVSIWLF